MRNGKIRKVADVALSVAILCVFSWIAIPTAPPITMQTLAVFLIALILPLWEGLMALCVYVALGCFVPVFSGFTTIGALLASAGAGYVLGFFFIVLLCALGRKISDNRYVLLAFCFIGLLLCYALGALWYSIAYLSVSLGAFTVLSVCVFPFLLPDAIKLAVAVLVYGRVKKYLAARRVK